MIGEGEDTSGGRERKSRTILWQARGIEHRSRTAQDTDKHTNGRTPKTRRVHIENKTKNGQDHTGSTSRGEKNIVKYIRSSQEYTEYTVLGNAPLESICWKQIEGRGSDDVVDVYIRAGNTSDTVRGSS